MPTPITAPPEPVIYRLCARCGIDVEPRTGTPRHCRDCRDLVQSYRKDALLDQCEDMWRDGMTQRAISRALGVHHSTIAGWITGLRHEFPEVEFLHHLRTRPAGVRPALIDAYHQLAELEASA